LSDGYFQDRFWWTICLGWLWTLILLICASQVARITDVSHQHPSSLCPYLENNWQFSVRLQNHLRKKFVFRDRVLSCSPGWPWTWYPPASVSWMLGLQCALLQSVLNFSLSLFFFFVGLRVEFRTSSLQSRHSPTSAISPVHLAVASLVMGPLKLFAGLALNQDPLNLSFAGS
jgi:hypothetical protein